MVYKVGLIAGLFYLSTFPGMMNMTGTTDDIAIQVIDGRTGKPLMHQHILVFGGETDREAEQQQSHYEPTTDDKGLAILSLSKRVQWIQVWVDWNSLCQNKQLKRNFSIAEISASGLNSINACSSISLNKIPGRLIIYVRPEHFWEKMKH